MRRAPRNHQVMFGLFNLFQTVSFKTLKANLNLMTNYYIGYLNCRTNSIMIKQDILQFRETWNYNMVYEIMVYQTIIL